MVGEMRLKQPLGTCLALSMLLLFTMGCKPRKSVNTRPNIIYILIDDLGYGDPGCYGSTVNHTPAIDRMASEGMIFRDFHSNGPMCTPTRAALMTGKYQHRFGAIFEGPLSGRTQRDKGLPLEARTIAEVLKGSGYATGMYGKWHLGYEPPFLPCSQGFDDFRGLGSGDGDHFTHINRWGVEDWWHNNAIDMEKGYSVDLITDHSISFIEKHQREPFFLFVSHLAIHFPWQGPDDPPQREKGKEYADDKWGIIGDRNNVSPHVKSMLEAVDTGVAKILLLLKKLELTERTLVVLASDNGGYIHYNNQFHKISNNGLLRGQKAEVYEGGHRVPCIAWWPGKIKPGSVSDDVVMSMDMFPTFATLAGAEVPTDLQLDGVEISKILFENAALPERAVCWKIGQDKAVRRGPWKLCMVENLDAQLFNLKDDIGESRDLSTEYPDTVNALLELYEDWERDVTAGY